MTPVTTAPRHAAPTRTGRAPSRSPAARPRPGGSRHTARSGPRAAPRRVRVGAPRPRRRRRLAVTLAVAVSLLAVFGVVGFNAFLVQSQFRLERLQQELDAERQEFERLRLETARLSSPERILDIARNELGMVDPEAVTNLTAPAGAEALDGGASEGRAWAEVKPFLASEP